MIMMVMMMNTIAQSTITKFNDTAQITNSLRSQHKAQLETLTLQQKKGQLGTVISQHKSQLETLTQ
jgi:hypothetical protein